MGNGSPPGVANKERRRQLLKRLLLSVTLMTVLATLMIGTAGYAKDFTCTSFCKGTDKDDTITGTDNHNEIRGQDGSDTIDGKGGDDDLYGNGKDDTLYGREGNDNLYGGSGNDTLWGGTGDDHLYGGDGNDYLADQKGPLTDDPEDIDYLDGGAGND